jgi:hypothetical protein
MAKPSKEDFLMQAIDTVVDLAVQSTERIADLLPADLFAPAMAPVNNKQTPFNELLESVQYVGSPEWEEESSELL